MSRLSKSKIVRGLQCQKSLYLSVHNQELEGETSASQQAIFDQGNIVGIEAQRRFPGGVLIDAPHTDSQLALAQTQEAIAAGACNIYEATFQHDGVLVKVDILSRESTRHAWNIYEVKSSTSVKEVHVQDASVQLWVVRENVGKVKSVSIMHINNQCTYPDLSDLFTISDVTTEATDSIQNILKSVYEFKKMLAKEIPPKIDIGHHCDDPYECSFKEHCWSARKIPTPSVFDIPRLSTEKKWQYYDAGKVALGKLSAKDFNATQRRMIECSTSGSRHVDSKSIAAEIGEWKYPLSFLDFETIGFAIPKFDGQRPYQQIPFQFSCHVKNSSSGKLEHCEYLHIDETDPREAIARALVELVPKKGSVVTYNMGFESSVLKGLAELFPKHRPQLKSIIERLVDPLPIFRAHVYDPAFNGSFSIKEVAPALLGKTAGYEGMAVGDGTEAQSAFLEMIQPATILSRKAELRKGLIEYCTKDTMGMVLLVGWLFEQTKLAEPASTKK